MHWFSLRILSNSVLESTNNLQARQSTTLHRFTQMMLHQKAKDATLWKAGLNDKMMVADLEAGMNWTYSIAPRLTSNLRVLRNGGEVLAIFPSGSLIADCCVVFPSASCSLKSKRCRCWVDILRLSISVQTLLSTTDFLSLTILTEDKDSRQLITTSCHLLRQYVNQVNLF